MLRELFNSVKSAKLTDISSTTLLTGMGVSGVVTTAYFTGRASFKAAELIRKEEDRRETSIITQGEDMTTKEKVKLVWPLYVAPVSVGATTITSIVMANHVASKKIAALALASGISDRALAEYKAKVIEKFGENKATDVRDEIAQDRITNTTPPSKEVLIVGAGDVLCFDMMTGRYFQSTVEKIRQAQNKINAELINHMYASLSMFYDEIGIPPTPYSDTVGWNVNEYLEVQISTVMSPDQRPCVCVDFAVPPIAEYARMW